LIRAGRIGLALAGMMLLAACGALAPATDGAPAPAADQAAQNLAKARQAEGWAKAAALGAEIAYDTLCVSPAAPQTCSDPKAVAVYDDAKRFLDAAFAAADEALADGTYDDAKRKALAGDVLAALAKLEAVLSDLKAGRVPPPS